MEKLQQRSAHLDHLREFARSLITSLEDLSVEHQYLKTFVLESRICTEVQLRHTLESVKKVSGVQNAVHEQFAETLATLNDLLQAAIFEDHLADKCSARSVTSVAQAG